jgi:hypothetical protein
MYLLFAILGTILPYYFLISFLVHYGLNFELIGQQLFASELGAFFVMDVLITAIVLWTFVFTEGHRLGMKYLWAYVLATLFVGVSFAFPLFLYYREKYLVLRSKSSLIGLVLRRNALSS